MPDFSYSYIIFTYVFTLINLRYILQLRVRILSDPLAPPFVRYERYIFTNAFICYFSLGIFLLSCTIFYMLSSIHVYSCMELRYYCTYKNDF